MKNKFTYLVSLIRLALSFLATSCDKAEDEETTEPVVIENM